MKPFILISPDYSFDPDNGAPYNYVRRSYSLVLSGAGAVPFMALNAKMCKDYAEMTDGLVIADSILRVSPGRYGRAADTKMPVQLSSIPVNPAKDSMDLSLCEAFLQAGKPILGIGRGMHVINTIFGGDLAQVLSEPSMRIHNSFVEHEIVPDVSSKLFRILGEKAYVFSCHGQAVGKPGAGLNISALSDDGVIEAFEHETLPVFGVQWHPEVIGMPDQEMHTLYQHADALAAPISKESNEIRKRQYTRKTVVPEFRNGFDSPRPDDNALFNAFVSLCRKRSEKNE